MANWASEERQERAAFRETNLTPLIDVSLVLVVILLLATPLAFESSILVRNTSSSGAQAPVKKKMTQVELLVLDDSQVRVNRSLVERADLADVLRPMLAENPSSRVVIRCEDGVSHGAFVNVLDQAKVSGAVELAVMGK
jgi:biopolymer transport protein ExbD